VADIVYEIGAKDTATPTLDKVGSSMSRLEKSTKDLGEHSERSLGRLSIGIGSLVKASGVLFAVDKAIQGISAALSFVGDSIGGVREAEAAAAELSSAMLATGQASEAMVEANIRLADSLEAMTGTESEAVQGLMAMAANLGAPVEQLDDLSRASVGLAESMGISLESALTKVRQAQEGNFAAFEKKLPQLKQMATDEEKLAAVMSLASRGIEQQTERYNGTAGAMARAMKAANDFGETVAAAVMPVIDAATNAVAGIAIALTDVFGGALESSGDMVQSWQEFLSEKITQAANAVIGAITMAEVIVRNFGDVWGLVKDKIALRVETIRADIEQLFTVTLPAYGSWFATNFPRFFVDAFDAIATVIDNGATKVANSIQAIWDFIATGGEGGVSGLVESVGAALSGSLLDGFESTVQALPQIAGRAMTDTERMLTASINDTATKLAAEYESKMASRTIKIGGKIGEDMATAIDLTLKKKEQEAAAAANDPASALAQLANRGGSALAALNANESRLLTRGPGGRMSIEAIFDEMLKIARKTYEATAAGSAAQALAASEAREAKEALQRKGSVMFARPPQ
jgi:hypothetical protein